MRSSSCCTGASFCSPIPSPSSGRSSAWAGPGQAFGSHSRSSSPSSTCRSRRRWTSRACSPEPAPRPLARTALLAASRRPTRAPSGLPARAAGWPSASRRLEPRMSAMSVGGMGVRKSEGVRVRARCRPPIDGGARTRPRRNPTRRKTLTISQTLVRPGAAPKSTLPPTSPANPAISTAGPAVPALCAPGAAGASARSAASVRRRS
mmetsp:Transcript_6346/g.19924  ORF Transcript_6346/g.19924 Transcript_6346/m.19924 type:complete len:206 (+) Transcript_6346:769-1386(+)